MRPTADIANLFPEMSPTELDALAADVAEHGLRERILRYRGEVVDGRHRLWACESAGIRPRFDDLPDDTPLDAVLARVVSANLHRRHLTDSQRVDLALQLEQRGLTRSAAARSANVTRDALYKRERREGVDMSTSPPGPPVDVDDPAAQGALAWDEEQDDTDEVNHTSVLVAPATPAKAARDPLDRYYTPDHVAQACVNALQIENPGRILEPSVGGGAFVRACRARWPDATVFGVDVDPSASGLELCDHADRCDLADYGIDDFELVVGNPPFTHAEAHLLPWLGHAAELGTVVAVLLKLSFLGAATRRDFWQRFPPTELHTLRPRPGFLGPGGGTDQQEYGLFVWRFDGAPKHFAWIDT